MMVDLDTAVAIAKVIWPVAVWVALVNQRLKKLEHDVDYLYYVFRGRKGKRDRTLFARMARTKFEIRKRIFGKSSSKNIG